MTLDDFRKEKGWSYGKLGRVLGTDHTRMASRWCKNEVIPNKVYMDRILNVTMGAVTPNDFYINRD